MPSSLRRLLIPLILAVAVFVLAAIFGPLNFIPLAASSALRSPGADAVVTLYSLRPGEQSEESDSTFHHFRILGKADLIPVQAKSACRKILSDIPILYGVQAICFNPRHGLRIKTPDKTLDYLICYQCGKIYIYINNTLSEHYISNSSEELDRLLTAAGIPLRERIK
ncbi:MAG: hypothetical protein ACAI35_27595 [Candidatus Methylacidiphilales bacterium]|nr:hypothetical protein [Candidatus Methylacidiphilales bacterium]